MIEYPKILAEALSRETAHLDVAALADVIPDTNVFENVDSMTIVNLLLQTEMMLEAETGNYVTLADETVFDAKKSPLLKWSYWIQFVRERHDG